MASAAVSTMRRQRRSCSPRMALARASRMACARGRPTPPPRRRGRPPRARLNQSGRVGDIGRAGQRPGCRAPTAARAMPPGQGDQSPDGERRSRRRAVGRWGHLPIGVRWMLLLSWPGHEGLAVGRERHAVGPEGLELLREGRLAGVQIPDLEPAGVAARRQTLAVAREGDAVQVVLVLLRRLGGVGLLVLALGVAPSFFVSLPSATSQTRSVRSCEIETTPLLSGVKTTPVTGSSWPLSCLVSFWAATS